MFRSGFVGEKEIDIKRVRNLVRGTVVQDKGCIIKSYRVVVLCLIIIIGTIG